MHELLTADLGPDFYGFHGLVTGRIVCVATPRVEHDAAARRIVRNLIRRQGGARAACQAGIIGQHDEHWRGGGAGGRMPAGHPAPSSQGAHMAYVEWRGNTCRVVWNTRQKDERGKWIYDQKGG